MWLISVTRPRVFVELGTHYGTSYCGFCQAIAALGLPTRTFAVDTWEGDPHAGAIVLESLAELKAHHDPRYQTFSTLLQMTFDQAVSRFPDGEIDLLHIDGYHTYEAVRHDFETWRFKLSRRGVVLFHDVAEKIHDFGVWKLWDELKVQYPSFTFDHEHGLGVLAVGSEPPEAIHNLATMEGDQADSVRGLFELLGSRIQLQIKLDSIRAERDAHLDSFQKAMASCQPFDVLIEEARQQRERKLDLEREVARLRGELERLQGVDQENCRLRRLEAELRNDFMEYQKRIAEVEASISWGLTHRLAALGRAIAPPGTRRRRMLKQAVQLAHPAHGQEIADSNGN